MNEEFTRRSEEIKKKFLSFTDQEERYNYLIELGRKLAPCPVDLKTPENLVPGCQSALYLCASTQDGKLFFHAHTDSLISAGLAALLIGAYNGLPPTAIAIHPPLFLQELGIFSSLSPSRSNGLAHIYLKMKKLALTFSEFAKA